MVIDIILDRKDGFSYEARDLYDYVMASPFECYEPIRLALDYGEEEDVKKALCDYILNNEYNPAICDYVNNVRWL